MPRHTPAYLRPPQPRPALRTHAAFGATAISTPKANPLADPVQKERIRVLAIPPARREVSICPSPGGHVPALGTLVRPRPQDARRPGERRGYCPSSSQVCGPRAGPPPCPPVRVPTYSASRAGGRCPPGEGEPGRDRDAGDDVAR
ncbi:hypothetical protein ACFYVL_00685 [Streptomyces sp. NPDC004111]|uniref:hypothetical protein n=1 Tax=Streptomyces sp. NPDC004111 TaxID=3364690 RepID=UPI003690DE88